jgi:TRAP-type C4-dicarboxylate transport system permease small subunit
VLRVVVWVERVVSVGLLGMVLGLMSAQVVARYVFRAPMTWSEELARFGLIWLAFVAATFVMADGRHIVVDVVSRFLSRRGRVILDCVSGAVVVVTCLVLLPAGGQFAWQMGGVKSSALGIPMSWWYAAPVTGLLLLAMHSGVEVLLTIRRGAPRWDSARPGGLGPDGGGGA